MKTLLTFSAVMALALSLGAAPAHAARYVDSSDSVKAGIDAPARDLAGKQMAAADSLNQENAVLLSENFSAADFTGLGGSTAQTYQGITADKKAEAALDYSTRALGLSVQPEATVLGSIQ